MNKLLNIFVLVGILALVPFSNASATCGIGGKIWGKGGSFGKKAIVFTTDIFTFKGISTTFEVFGCGPGT